VTITLVERNVENAALLQHNDTFLDRKIKLMRELTERDSLQPSS